MSDKLGEPAVEDKKLSALAGLGMVVLWVVSIILPFELAKIVDSQMLVFALLALSISGVFVFSLLWTPRSLRITLTIAFGTGMIIALFGYFAAQRFSPGEASDPTFVLLFVGQVLILLVGLLPYLQSRLSTGSWSWKAASIFEHAWSNGIILFCGLLATVVLFAGTFAAGRLAEALDSNVVKAFTHRRGYVPRARHGRLRPGNCPTARGAWRLVQTAHRLR